MKKIFLLIGMCIMAFVAGAQTTISLTSNSWGEGDAKQYNIQGMQKVSAGEWKTGDVISVELVGITETAVSGLEFTLVDNSSAANWWLPLSETISLGESFDANGEISYKGEVTLIADVVTSSSVQIVFGTAGSKEEATENGTLTFSTFKVEKPGDVVNPHDNLSLADLSAGWESSYDATTSTITFDAGWVGRGWWLGGVDLSEYSSVTVEFEAAPFDGKLVVQRADETMMEATFSAGATSVKCMLTDEISNINQIFIQNSEAGDLVLTTAYYTKKGFEEGGEQGGEEGGQEGGNDPVEPVFTFEVPTTTFEAEYKDGEISGYTAKIEMGVNDLMLKKDDIVSLVFDGSFNADVTGVSPAIVDQWEEKQYWYELSGWDWTQFDSKANQEINITVKVTLVKDAETTAIIVCIPVQGGNGEEEIVFTSAKTSEEGGEQGGEEGGQEGGNDPVEPVFTFEVPTTTFVAEYKDGEISGYTAKIEMNVNDLMLKKDDIVSLVFDGSFNTDVTGISPAIVDQWEEKQYWYELSGWDWTQFDSKANQKINITAKVTLIKDAETNAIIVCIPVQGGNGEEEIVFTSAKTPIEAVASNSFSIENGVVYSTGEITIYNIVGKPVATASQVFDVNSLPTGVYFIVAQEGIIKFVK